MKLLFVEIKSKISNFWYSTYISVSVKPGKDEYSRGRVGMVGMGPLIMYTNKVKLGIREGFKKIKNTVHFIFLFI